MKTPYLVSLSAAAVDEIPQKVVPRTVRLQDPTFESGQAIEWIVGGYCDKLLYKNERLQELLQKFVGRVDDSECWDCLTQGQRILHSLGALDGQVNNGGITQFFWNCPDLVFPASDALKALGEMDLLKSYDKALNGLIGNQKEWAELRKQAFSNPDCASWEQFQESYRVLDLGWFDGAYFGRHGPALIKRLAKYVRSHKEEFIET